MKEADLNQAQKDQLEQAKQMVKQQQDALDAIREPLNKLVEGDDLTPRDERALTIHLRWTDEERAAIDSMTKEERKVQVDRILADPYVYFYVGHNEEGLNPTHRVYVTTDGVEIQDEEHPDF